MKILNFGDKVGIIACSNGVDLKNKNIISELIKVLNDMGITAELSNKLYKKYSVFTGSEEERAEELMKLFCDDTIRAIFDVSGGDLANGILDYLDFELIKKNPKPFFGYSDLSAIVNSIYSQCDIKTYLYQIRNLVGKDYSIQQNNFKDTLIYDNNNSLLNFKYKWIQGKSMEGIVVGGNIRCFLKLSGTKYMPDFTDKILFIESMSGDCAKMYTYLAQYKQIGAFDKIKGIILGSYTEMEREQYKPDIIELVTRVVDNPEMPIVKTSEIGHGSDSKCIIIGEYLKLD